MFFFSTFVRGNGKSWDLSKHGYPFCMYAPVLIQMPLAFDSLALFVFVYLILVEFSVTSQFLLNLLSWFSLGAIWYPPHGAGIFSLCCRRICGLKLFSALCWVCWRHTNAFIGIFFENENKKPQKYTSFPRKFLWWLIYLNWSHVKCCNRNNEKEQLNFQNTNDVFKIVLYIHHLNNSAHLVSMKDDWTS